MMGVEGVPQRDEPVTFTAHYWSYNPGEVACFHADEAQALIDRGVAEALPDPEAPNGENGEAQP